MVRGVIRVVDWWRKQLPIVLRARTSPRGARRHLLSLDVPGGFGAGLELWRRLAPAEFRLELGAGQLYFSGTTINSDRGTFGEIFVADAYRSDYQGAMVIDIGAHKGYFGAYALLNGASAVVSYEPEAGNFSFLERTAASFRESGHEWTTVRAAVASETGDVALRVSRESWAHSVVWVAAREETGRIQTVRGEAMHDVLRAARGVAGRVIVKIDVEGAECDVICGTPRNEWSCVDELFVEIHSFAPCTSADVIAHLGMAVIGGDGTLRLTKAGP